MLHLFLTINKKKNDCEKKDNLLTTSSPWRNREWKVGVGLSPGKIGF